VWRTQSKHFSYGIDVFPIIELVAGNSHISLQLLTRNLFVHFVRPLPKSKRNAWQAADSSCWTQTPKWSSILRYSDSQILRYYDIPGPTRCLVPLMSSCCCCACWCCCCGSSCCCCCCCCCCRSGFYTKFKPATTTSSLLPTHHTSVCET